MLICNSFNNDLDRLKNLKYEELSAIDGIGDIIAGEWVDTSSDSKFLEELDRLKSEDDLLRMCE